MIRRSIIGLLALAGAVAAFAAAAAPDEGGIRVEAGENLQAAVDNAAAGATVVLAAGNHAGPIKIDHSVTLAGEPGAILRGRGVGSVVTVTGDDVTIQGLTIEGSGRDVPSMDAAILAERPASRLLVKDNHLAGNLFGVYLHGAVDSRVDGNLITGMVGLRLSDRGNGVSLWNAPGSIVAGNDIRDVRDGIFVNNSRKNRFLHNRFASLRFAIHYMYTHDSEIIANLSTGNDVGYAIMYSDHLRIEDNVSIGDRDHGLLLNYANRSVVSGNLVRDGGEKCLFIYNAHRNLIEANRFEGCSIGIHFTAGSERNTVAGNAFIRNRTQVKYVGTRLVEWSHEGSGNYWSDNPAFDLDGDGISDRPYQPNDLVDDILWRHPSAKLLLNSPAIDLVRLVQSRFPALYPGGVVDSAPLMTPPTQAAEAP
ncbi:nitrous oxidase accessory protein [Dongia mobilis]|uniref:Nitrous oxidase accessory protein n=1 Tax=Dongia mobilis TaxID=578943 RepID=A0A4R6WT26_9PROT|nr:nitrous oxide reductase family maturation protein NosD [Dongia mobilis]TDQ82919.1 nitrous oxidase accessory protein [Dongia mobilis]